MGGFQFHRAIELNQLEVPQPINPSLQQKLGFLRLAKITTLFTLIVGIFVGFGFLVYLCTRVSVKVNKVDECNFTRPSEILDHMLKVNDHLLVGLTATEASKPSRFQIDYHDRTLRKLNLVNETQNEIRKSITILEKNKNVRGIRRVGSFDFSSALSSLVNLTATIANEQTEMDLFGIVLTSKGHIFLRESQFTKESFVDTQFCKVSQDDLNILHQQFGIIFLDEMPEHQEGRSFKKEDLIDTNDVLKKFREFLKNREARFNELVKAFDIHKPNNLDKVTRDETLNRVRLEDGPPIPYYHGNSSVVDRLREATGSIKRAVSEEPRWKYELNILAQHQILEHLKESFAFTKATLRNRRKGIEEVLRNVKCDIENLYLKVLLLAEESGSHRIVFV